MPAPKDPDKRKLWLKRLKKSGNWFKKGVGGSGNKRIWTDEMRSSMSQKQHKRFQTESAWNKGIKFNAIRGENHWNWKGGKIKTRFGYIRFYKPDHPHSDCQGYIFEHIIILEQYLGRYLIKTKLSTILMKLEMITE